MRVSVNRLVWCHIPSSKSSLYFEIKCQTNSLSVLVSCLRTIMKRVFEAVQYIHSHNIVHRDLKVGPPSAKNYLFSQRDTNPTIVIVMNLRNCWNLSILISHYKIWLQQSLHSSDLQIERLRHLNMAPTWSPINFEFFIKYETLQTSRRFLSMV